MLEYEVLNIKIMLFTFTQQTSGKFCCYLIINKSKIITIMIIQLNTDKNLTIHSEYEAQITQKLNVELERYTDYITRIEVHMSDENGSHFSNSSSAPQDEKLSLSKESYYSNISSKQSSTMGDPRIGITLFCPIKHLSFGAKPKPNCE